MDIGIISKKDGNSIAITNKLINLLKDHNLYFDFELAEMIDSHNVIDDANRLELIIWIGGDGTLLRYVNKIKRFKAKLLGIKTGGIGFLCEISPEKIEESLRLFFEEKYYIESRSLVEVRYLDNPLYALNDIVLYSSELGRVSRFITYKDGELIFEGRCDGILISTSLGSTAYIASRGGPIVDPDLDLLIFDPLNPLKWGMRMLILPFESKLEIESNKDCKLILDGNLITEVKSGSRIYINGTKEKFEFIRYKKSFYEKLRNRMLQDA